MAVFPLFTAQHWQKLQSPVTPLRKDNVSLFSKVCLAQFGFSGFTCAPSEIAPPTLNGGSSFACGTPGGDHR